jgi:hypothetical protein
MDSGVLDTFTKTAGSLARINLLPQTSRQPPRHRACQRGQIEAKQVWVRHNKTYRVGDPTHCETLPPWERFYYSDLAQVVLPIGRASSKTPSLTFVSGPTLVPDW